MTPASDEHSQTCLFARTILAGLWATPSSILGDPAVPGIEPWASRVQSVLCTLSQILMSPLSVLYEIVSV